ncbi:MAG: hypothetical protein L6R30_04435 [Thermoanaerobaculia bacterium]|nr:hypothetical protein [Thermoanaerobaculia bacterium]
MSDPRRLKPDTRTGQLGSYWGNVLLDAGELSTGDLFTFEDEDGILNVVKRVLVNPLDQKKNLYHYERVDRFNAPAPKEAEH